MQELQAELEKAQSSELAAARKSAADSRANFTMSMDSLDVEVHVCSVILDNISPLVSKVSSQKG